MFPFRYNVLPRCFKRIFQEFVVLQCKLSLSILNSLPNKPSCLNPTHESCTILYVKRLLNFVSMSVSVLLICGSCLPYILRKSLKELRATFHTAVKQHFMHMHLQETAHPSCYLFKTHDTGCRVMCSQLLKYSPLTAHTAMRADREEDF